MIYTVAWTRPARNALATLWNNNVSARKAITAATHAIDRELRIDAHRKGVPHPGGRRLLRMPPLAVVFTVNPGDCMATVVQVVRIS
ncbi:MAG TPA: hypothetical protein VMS17_25915 [Gemmataceae bacterium]|nr:hypothetical protein [Gemmataceae bacterium]